MTQASFPFENIDTTETQFSKWARHFNNGVNDDPNGDALEVSVGTGLAVNVEPGEAMVRGHYYTSDATESLSLTTADASNDRIDTVVLRLDPVANSIVLAVRAGTPDAAPVAPTLVQTDAGVFEQPLANVLVPATSGVPTTITDRREFMSTRLHNGTPAYRFVDTVYFTSSGTFVKADYPWLRAIRVKCQGAGGGGGGTQGALAGEMAVGAGGGGGAYAESFITDIAGLDASVTVTVAAGAAGGTGGATPTDGGDAGASSFGTAVTADGGGGGHRCNATSANAVPAAGGSDGGDSGTGDLVIYGSWGTVPLTRIPNRIIASRGGSSHLGGATDQNRITTGNLAGRDGRQYGGGATGGMTSSNSPGADGGDGADGIVIVELYG